MAHSSSSPMATFSDISQFVQNSLHRFVPYYEEMLKNNQGILTQKDVTDIQKALEKWKLGEAASKIEEKLEAAEKASLNIAVMGEAGSGKFTFINAVRGLGDDEEGSAPTGVVETTMVPTPYQHPKFPNVTLWDLPGTETPNFQPEEYLKKVAFERYDFLIIIASEPFKSSSVDLAREIQRMEKKFYFVRTMTVEDPASAKEGKPGSSNEESLPQLIRDDCLESLKKGSVSHPRVFLISSFDMGLYDFGDLEDTLVRELPAHQRHTLRLALPSVTEEAIEKKKLTLQEKIGLEATKECLRAPFSGIFSPNNREELEKCLPHYRSLLGVDDASLAKLAEREGREVRDLKAALKSYDMETVLKNSDALPSLVNSVKEKIKTSLSCVSFFGNLLSTIAISRTQIYTLQWHALDTVAEDAKLLLKKTQSTG